MQLKYASVLVFTIMFVTSTITMHHTIRNLWVNSQASGIFQQGFTVKWAVAELNYQKLLNHEWKIWDA